MSVERTGTRTWVIGTVVYGLALLWGSSSTGPHTDHYLAGHVVFGAGSDQRCVAAASTEFSLLPQNSARPEGDRQAPSGAFRPGAVVAMATVPVRNSYEPRERLVWPWPVIAMGSIALVRGVVLLILDRDGYYRPPGLVMIGPGLVLSVPRGFVFEAAVADPSVYVAACWWGWVRSASRCVRSSAFSRAARRPGSDIRARGGAYHVVS